MLNVGLAINKQTDDLVAALEAGQGQGRVAVRLNLGIDVTALVQEKLHGCRVPIHGREHQRWDAQLTASPVSRRNIALYNLAGIQQLAKLTVNS